MGHVVVGTVEGDVPLFSPYCELALSGTNLRIILHVQTLARSILCEHQHFCSLIAISYTELHSLLMGQVLIGVIVGDAPLIFPNCEPALSGTNLRMILCVQTLA